VAKKVKDGAGSGGGTGIAAPDLTATVEAKTAMTKLDRVQAALDAAGIGADLEVDPRYRLPGLHYVTRADGTVVRLDYRQGVTAAQQASGDSLVMALDLSPAGLALADTTRLRELAKTLFDATDERGKRDRAIALTAIDAINTLRGWLTSFKAAVAAAATLADLKARVAALPNLPDLQPADARNAVRSRLDSGSVDNPPA
jgi:hypothetical protein